MRHLSLSLLLSISTFATVSPAIAQQVTIAESTSGPLLTRVITTEEVWSGEGKAFNPIFYVVQSGTPPTGYELYKQSFRLVGARGCFWGDGEQSGTIQPQAASGAIINNVGWAECRLEERTGQNVRWGFRMQGDDSTHQWQLTSLTFNNGINGSFRIHGTKQTSRGVLTVIYRKKAGSK